MPERNRVSCSSSEMGLEKPGGAGRLRQTQKKLWVEGNMSTPALLAGPV